MLQELIDFLFDVVVSKLWVVLEWFIPTGHIKTETIRRIVVVFIKCTREQTGF